VRRTGDDLDLFKRVLKELIHLFGLLWAFLIA